MKKHFTVDNVSAVIFTRLRSECWTRVNRSLYYLCSCWYVFSLLHSLTYHNKTQMYNTHSNAEIERKGDYNDMINRVQTILVNYSCTLLIDPEVAEAKSSRVRKMFSEFSNRNLITCRDISKN